MRQKLEKLNAGRGDDFPPPCMIFVDKDGVWFHKGAPITHQGFLQLFYDSLYEDGHGNYIIKFKDQVCRLDVEDTPFVVLSVDYSSGEKEEKDCIVLRLIDGTKERLDPGSLFVGSEHVLYCKIKNGEFNARFSRPSYYQLAQYIEEEAKTGRFFVSLNGEKVYIEERSGHIHNNEID